MKGKNGVKLADFIREIINTKISKKPVKSRIFEDLEGIRKAPPRLLLSGRSGVQIPFGAPQAMPKAFVFKGFRFFIFVKNEKNEKVTVFHWLFFRLLTEFMTDVVRLSGGFFYVIRCVFL